MQTMNPEQSAYYPNMNEYSQPPNGRYNVNGLGRDKIHGILLHSK